MKFYIRIVSFVLGLLMFGSDALAQASPVSVEEFNQLSQRVTQLERDISEIKSMLSERSYKVEDDSAQPSFGALHPSEKALTVYVMPDKPTYDLDDFFDYLKVEIPNIAIVQINTVDDIPADQRDKAIILYVHQVVSERLYGYVNESRFADCGKQSNGRCIWTSLRQHRARDFQSGAVVATNQSKSIRPSINSLEFRHIFGKFHSAADDAYNKKEIDLLLKVLEKNK